MPAGSIDNLKLPTEFLRYPIKDLGDHVAFESTAYFPGSLVDEPRVLNYEKPDPSSAGAALREPARDTLAHEPNSDPKLIAAVASGSKEALGLLFRHHRRAVLNVALRILKDASEAEDLCQEVFLSIFKNARLFDPKKGSESSWIIQNAYHKALNRRQYLLHRQHYDLQELNEGQIEDNSSRRIVEEILAKSVLKRLRDQLSAEQLRTLELHFFEGYSLREIAEKTGQNLGSVRHHYYRGLDRLRSNLFPQKGR